MVIDAANCALKSNKQTLKGQKGKSADFSSWILIQPLMGAIHKLRWQVLAFSDHLPPFVDSLFLVKVDIFRPLPTHLFL